MQQWSAYVDAEEFMEALLIVVLRARVSCAVPSSPPPRPPPAFLMDQVHGSLLFRGGAERASTSVEATGWVGGRRGMARAWPEGRAWDNDKLALQQKGSGQCVQ